MPSEPVNLSTETISSTNVLLKWEDALDEGTAQKNYTVTWTSDQTNGAKEGVNENSTNILNLTSNTEYSFNIYAVNAGGFGKSSTAETSITCKLRLRMKNISFIYIILKSSIIMPVCNIHGLDAYFLKIPEG